MQTTFSLLAICYLLLNKLQTSKGCVAKIGTLGVFVLLSFYDI